MKPYTTPLINNHTYNGFYCIIGNKERFIITNRQMITKSFVLDLITSLYNPPVDYKLNQTDYQIVHNSLVKATLEYHPNKTQPYYSIRARSLSVAIPATTTETDNYIRTNEELKIYQTT